MCEAGCYMAVKHMQQEEKYVRQAYTELNPLTGLYYNRAFFKKADKYLKGVEPRTYSFVAIDIEHFRLFNKLYGREAGDELLVYIAECLKKIQREHGGIAGYLGGDNFCLLMPDEFGLVRELKYDIIKGVNQWSNTVGFLPAIGVYSVEDITVPAMVMYDRATIALAHVVGNYAKRIRRYDASMEEKLEEELSLLTDIQAALENDEFTFYAQPQCDIITGKIVGAESLVRWNHRTKGLISPGIFIPVLEKTGFIADLDRYVWRKVCEWLRSWIDRGYKPVPISVNVSRLDIFSMDVPVYLTELIEEYGLPPKLIKVEITESAYSESNDKIIKAVRDLRIAGFLVMMDDFGSGYSSLNMLKDVAVDVLKLDMRFLDIREKEEEKGINIIESVVNMARMMGLPIIVEGVETKKQETMLLNLGCRYTQGYYYYRPLSIPQFEELLSDERRLDNEGIRYKQVESLHVREFLDDNLFSDTMVNNMLGAAAFYEMYDNQITITRVNEQYYRLAGVSSDAEADDSKKFWNHVRDDDRTLLYSIFEQAYENPTEGAQGYVHYVRTDGKVLWVYLRVFFLREKAGRRMFYSSLTDMTDSEKKKKQELSEYSIMGLSEEQQARMEKYYGNLPCGYAVIRILVDEQCQPGGYEVVFANREMENFCGGNVRRFRTLISMVFGDNMSEVMKKAYQAAYFGETLDHYVYVPISNLYLHLTFYQFERGYVACMLQDATHTHIYEDALKGVMQSYREVYFVHFQDNYCRMIYPDENNMLERGNYEETVNRHFGTGKILKYDQECVRKFLSLENLREALKVQNSVEYKYRRSAPGIPDEWCLTSFTVSERDNKGMPKTAIAMVRSIEALMREEEERRRQNMAETLANMSDGFFVYRATEDEQILFANPAVLKIFACDTFDEFRELVGNSFHGMIHPEDLNRVKWEINEQIGRSERKMDYIRYRIRRKDGEIRWIDDCGHLEDSGLDEESRLFYVFISDITDTISAQQQEKLLNMNRYY